MRHSPHPLPLDACMRAVWQTQLAAAGTMPGLVPTLVHHHHELHSRFTAYDTRLRALPRRARRALQRLWRLPLAGIALMLALGQQPVQAATIAVGGSCTLVDAITAANTDTATGGCPAGNGADTIVLPAGSTQTLTHVNNSTYGPAGLPVISSVVTIAGQGSTIVRDSGALEFRIFAVNSTGDLTLQETTVSGGSVFESDSDGGGIENRGTLTVTNSIISENVAGFFGGGGGINNTGDLAVTNSIIRANRSVGGGGINNAGTLRLTNTIISENSARFNGGGIANSSEAVVIQSRIADNNSGRTSGGGISNSGTLILTQSVVSGNVAPTVASSGGGIDNIGDMVVTESTIRANRGGDPDGGVGGIANSGTLTLLRSTISDNRSGSGSSAPGGIENSGTLTMTNSTISGNTAGHEDTTYLGSGPGGIENSGTLTVTNSTISGNVSFSNVGGLANDGTVTLQHTIVAGNTATDTTIADCDDAAGGVTSLGHNLMGAGTGCPSTGPGDLTVAPTDVFTTVLGPLQRNGGRTETHALLPGSPAIDAGDAVCTDANGDPLLTDQRGRPRVVDGDGDGTAACDIGAFEFFPLVNDFVTLDPALETTFDPIPVLGGPAGTFTITATFTNTSDTPLRVPFFTVTELSGGNLVLNAEEGAQGVGATVPLVVEDEVLAPGETMAVDFRIGLQEQAPFRFFVDLFAEPLP
jgi:hypothetical protein